MSDYERGIEAAEDYVQTAHTGTTARGIIEAFLAVQPEAWWCEVHEQAACKWDSGGRSRCEPVFRGDTGPGPCRMVRKYLVDRL